MVSFACITIFVPIFTTSRLLSARRTLVFSDKKNHFTSKKNPQNYNTDFYLD